MIDINAHVRAAVERLGPPTPEQIARLRLIIAGNLERLNDQSTDQYGGPDAA